MLKLVFECKQQRTLPIFFLCFRLDEHYLLISPRFMIFDEVMVKMQTKGIVETILPVDIDIDWKRNGETWNFKIRSLSMNIEKLLFFNVSFTIDSSFDDILIHSKLDTPW